MQKCLPLVLVLLGCSGGSTATPPTPRDTMADAAPVDDAPPDGGRRDFVLTLHGMAADQGRMLDAWVVESLGNHVVGHAIVAALSGSDAEVRLPGLLDTGDYRVDFYADSNGNGRYDPPPADHAWSVPVPTTGDARVVFTYNASFTDIARLTRIPHGDARITLQGLGAEMGAALELRVIDPASGATVGAWSTAHAGSGAQIVLAGCVESGNPYNVDFYADTDHSGAYDAPPADHAWRVQATATADGLAITWTDGTDYTDVAWR